MMVLLKCIAFLFAAVALANCCVSGNGCYAPLPAAPIAWDGLGSDPTETIGQRKMRARKKKLSSAPSATYQGSQTLSLTPKMHGRSRSCRRADEAKQKQLMICRNCMAAPARDDATGSVTLKRTFLSERAQKNRTTQHKYPAQNDTGHSQRGELNARSIPLDFSWVIHGMRNVRWCRLE
jgi:hypothetical protein